MDSIIKASGTSHHTSIIQMPFSKQNWLLKILPWIDVGFNYNRVQIVERKRKLAEIPDNINILEKSNELFLSDLLRYVPIFKDLPDDLLKMVLKGIYQKDVNEGAVIVKQGEIGSSFFIILNGQYSVINNTPDGQEIILKTLTGGDYFGEMSLLQSMPRQATIKAKSKGSLVVLNKETFYKIIEDSQLKNNLESIFKQRKAELKQSVSHEGDKYLSGLLANFIEDPIHESLQSVHTSVSIDDLPNEFLTGKINTRFSIEIEKLTNQVEWEIINNKEYGLLSKVSANMVLDTKKSAGILDSLDELLSLVWNQPSYFLVHPKVLKTIGQECTTHDLIPASIRIWDNSFISWRGVPIMPSESMPLYNENENVTTDILLFRAGAENRGVIGLHNNNIFNPFNIPSLSVEIQNSASFTHITEYLVTKYYAVEVLSPDAVAALKNIII